MLCQRVGEAVAEDEEVAEEEEVLAEGAIPLGTQFGMWPRRLLM